MAVMFALFDGESSEQDTQGPTVQGPIGLACRFGLTSHGAGPNFQQRRPQDSHAARAAVKNANAIIHRELSPDLGRADSFLTLRN
jgi:hypothetical protein